jgi:ABC-2 type transport system ATP-binding protein
LEIVREEGTTVFLTSHNMAEVEKVCTRVMFLNEGRIQAEGTPQELARRLSWRRLTLKTRQPVEALPTSLAVAPLEWTSKNGTLSVKIDREYAGRFVTELVRTGVEITDISVQEPTLEDFFVHSARQGQPRD